MSKTQIFIEKARAVHGDCYDYDRVVYVRNSDKIIITCKKHGDFEQTPKDHLKGSGCDKCGRESSAAKRSEESKNSFIERSRAVHGDRYNYGRAVYVRSLDKVVITCKQHGDFEQTPADHLRGRGCARCGKESMAIKRSEESKNSFIEKARAVHSDRYDYGHAVYVRNSDKVFITCKVHGDFEQTPSNHLRGQGCPKCGIEATAAKLSQEAKDGFIEKACAIHGDKYDYGRAVYVRSIDNVIITCKKHGDFEQTPSNHLRGKGCDKCAGIYSYSTQEWVQEAISVHGDRYSYDRAVYVRSQEKVIITCKQHGDFEQTPRSHLNGSGCAKCSGVHRYSTQEWIQEAIAVHGEMYDYSKTAYVRDRDKVIITCAKHGDFEQTPRIHLNGSGCPSCPKRYDQPTNLYLMHNGLGKVKVGYTIDLNRRITELNCHAPFKAELLETWTLTDTPTALKIERKVHRKLAKYHAGLSGFEGATEWFNTTPKKAKTAILKVLSGADVLGYSNAKSSQLSLI